MSSHNSGSAKSSGARSRLRGMAGTAPGSSRNPRHSPAPRSTASRSSDSRIWRRERFVEQHGGELERRQPHARQEALAKPLRRERARAVRAANEFDHEAPGVVSTSSGRVLLVANASRMRRAWMRGAFTSCGGLSLVRVQRVPWRLILLRQILLDLSRIP